LDWQQPLRIQRGPKNQFGSIVEISPSLYGPDGYNTNIFCGINIDGALVEKKATLCEGLFHELCHAFHTYSHKEKFTTDYLDIVYSGRQEKYLWTGKEPKEYEDDEEMYNITGYYWNSVMD
jgi:hypothetical protein